MARLDFTLKNPALALARRRLRDINRLLLANPSAKTRPKWERLKAKLLEQIEGLEQNSTT